MPTGLRVHICTYVQYIDESKRSKTRAMLGNFRNNWLVSWLAAVLIPLHTCQHVFITLKYTQLLQEHSVQASSASTDSALSYVHNCK